MPSFNMRKFVLFLLLVPMTLIGQALQIESPIRFLALGDSYTIGQSVPVQARWPVQLADSLEHRGFEIDTLRIIATTGWRTDNLLNAIKNQNLENQSFNLVSILIGVNNQYQGRPINQYITELAAIIDSALLYAGGDPAHVFMVSIPDYAFTPFGQQSSDPEQISIEIDQYNAINKQMAIDHGITYFDITGISRQGLDIPQYVASDGLHPSGVQYTEWVKLMLDYIDNTITGTGDYKVNTASTIVVTPNPTSGMIQIKLPQSTNTRTKVEVFNMAGTQLMETSNNETTFTLSLESYSDGLYIVKINTGLNQSVFKILKKSG